MDDFYLIRNEDGNVVGKLYLYQLRFLHTFMDELSRDEVYSYIKKYYYYNVYSEIVEKNPEEGRMYYDSKQERVVLEYKKEGKIATAIKILDEYD